MIVSSKLWTRGDELPFSIASGFLEAITKCCPNVEHLVLHPCDIELDHVEYIPSQSWYRYIGVFQKLRRLSITEGWLDYPSLLALSRLPSLKDLDIWPGDLEGFDIPDDLIRELPPGAFPALRGLALKNLHPFAIAEIFSIRVMFERITHLFIRFNPQELDISNHDGHSPALWRNSWIVHRFLPLLQNTPCLDNLGVEFSSSEDIVYRIGVPEVLDVMAKLPLRTVHLDHMHLGTGDFDFDLGSIWPKVTKLSMPHQHASLQELSYFTAMPKLRRLIVMVDFTTRFTPQITTQHFSLNTLQSSYGSRLHTKFEILEHNAR